MKNNNIPLAIILKRTLNGFAFQALQQLHFDCDKNRKSKPGRKSTPKGPPNRLIKQIDLSNQNLTSQILPTPDLQHFHHPEDDPQQNFPPFQPITEEEQVSCEADRESEQIKSPAIWFDKLKINEMEKKGLKQFFSGSQSKTSELYMKYRNFIVESYQKNPRRYLTKISCRRILRGDVNAIMRIHAFLEKHGVINYSLDYDGNHSFKQTPHAKFHQKTIKQQTFLKSLPQNDEETAEKQIDTDNMTVTVINKNFSRTYRACCTECKLICSIFWFADANEEDSANQKNLCFQCWSKRNQLEKSQFSKIDIVKKMQAQGKNFLKNAWNIDQNIKLLDYMSNKESNWKNLLDGFGGKRTVQDVVLQFLQFPISNIHLKSEKKRIQQSLYENLDQTRNLGFGTADYKQILNDLYMASELAKKPNQIKQNGCQLQTNYMQKIEFQAEGPQQINQILSLTVEKIIAKIEGFKQLEDAVEVLKCKCEQRINLEECPMQCSSEQIGLKQLNQSDNKSKCMKNDLEKKKGSGSLEQIIFDVQLSN